MKSLFGDLAGNVDAQDRFRTEAHLSSRVVHPNVTRTLDFLEERGVPYIIQQLSDGRPLDRYVQEKGALPEREALDLLLQILSGVESIHAQDILHRALEPANVMVSEHPTGALVGRIIDFGVALGRGDESGWTRHGAIAGSPAYTAPEQARGGPVDERTDIYGAGLIFHRALGGADLGSQSLAESVRQTAESPGLQLDPARASARAQTLVRCLAAPEPSDRPTSAREAISRVYEDIGQAARAGLLSARL